MGIESIQVKLERADEHLRSFQNEVDRFASEKPFALHVVAPYGTAEVADVEWVRHPPARWGAIVGDCVHNLRSVLDHIVWDLSGGETGRAPNLAEFPIFRDEGRFFDRTKSGEPARGSGLWKIQGIANANARTFIRRLQPYTASEPTEHPLWVIHELDRLDKHRALHAVVGWAHTDLWRRGIKDVCDLPLGWRQIGATQAATYSRRMPVGVQVRMRVRFDLAMQVKLPAGTVGADGNIDTLLTRLIAFVRDQVVPEFAPML